MNNSENLVLGIDIGGTGIKMGITDISTGELTTERYKELTPKPSTTEAVADKIKSMVDKYFPDYRGIVGCGFPAIIKNGTALSAANVDKSWIGTSVSELIGSTLGLPCYCANDADVAGLAEVSFGDNEYDQGLIIVLTVGTGIGSAFFYNGVLIPNSELGHLYYNNESYERYVSNAAREREDLSWKKWGKRFEAYLEHVVHLFSPDGFIVGGGISKVFHKFEKHIDIDVPVSPASLKNAAGVIGASLYAQSMHYG